MIFNKRSNELEIMDLGNYTLDEYNDCLYKLGLIGTLLGGDRATLKELKKLKNIETVLDVGCGGGSFAVKLAKKNKKLKVVGIDIDMNAINYANNLVSTSNVFFEHRDTAELDEKENSFDVVCATLLLHHLTDDQIIEFFKRAQKIAKKAIIINDLQRSVFAYGLFKLITPLIKNKMTSDDGLLSIKRSFVKKDLKKYLLRSGFQENQFSIKWYWAFRWVVVVHIVD